MGKFDNLRVLKAKLELDKSSVAPSLLKSMDNNIQALNVVHELVGPNGYFPKKNFKAFFVALEIVTDQKSSL